MPFSSERPYQTLVKALTILIILDVEFLLCRVLDDQGQYVTFAVNFLNWFCIFSWKFVPLKREGKVIVFGFEM